MPQFQQQGFPGLQPQQNQFSQLQLFQDVQEVRPTQLPQQEPVVKTEKKRKRGGGDLSAILPREVLLKISSKEYEGKS
jgi:hypothetical protein